MKRRSVMRWQFLTSTISTTMVLLLLGTLVIFILTAKEIRDYVHQDLTLTIVMADGTKPAEAHAIENNISEKAYTHHINYISSEQALEEAVETMGIDPRELLDKNPFCISMELKLKANYVCNDSLEWIIDELKENEGIVDVIYQKELVETLNRNLNTITIILLVITAMLSTISISLINNTVYLSVYNHRFLINNMKLVGASWGFIRRPFLVRSLGIGLIATTIANSILVTLILWMIRYDHGLAQFIPKHNIVIMASCVLAFALVITLVCTYISVTRFLMMHERDLYK